MNKMLKLTVAAVIATATLGSTAVYAQDYALRFQSSDPAGSPAYKIQAEWGKTLEALTGGRVTLEVVPVGTIVDYSETLDAVAAGILDGHITDMSYWAGKDPAFSLLANPVGAWADPYQMLRFLEYGGGNELANEIMEPYGVHMIGGLTTGLEAFISKKPLDGVADLQGLKMRAPEGLVQQIFAEAGAAPVNLPFSEVFTSLDKGVIDAADGSVFSSNQDAGVHDVALHPVYPGFHSMPLIEASITKTTWDGMPDDIKAIMKVAVTDLAFKEINELAMRDLVAVAKARENPDLVIHNWSDEERAKFRAIARSQWEVVAAQSENAQKVYDALIAYLTDQGLLEQ